MAAPKNVEAAISIGETLMILVTDPDTGAEMHMTLTADGMFIPSQPDPGPDPGPDPEPEPIEGAAKWLSPMEATASSIETGDIIQVTAWGGEEYGYAYIYALEGAPMAVGIDSDTGRINLNSKLSMGDHQFTITATNREDASKTADFPFVLHVLEGITSGTPTASQIRHATFDPHSNTYGKPTSGDWTKVFQAINKAAKDLQAKCPEESLRCHIPLRRGVTYQFTDNSWTTGLQYFDVYATGSGAKPIMQNIKTGDPNAYNNGPLDLGYAGAIAHQEGIKVRCAQIATVAAGSTTVMLLNPGDGGRIQPGRWHGVMGSCMGIGGYPPTMQFVEYLKVVAVDGATVTLDRPLKYGYEQTWWENVGDDHNLGMARLVPMDMGGASGLSPNDPRMLIRGTFTNIDMLANPNVGGGPDNNANCLTYFEGCVDIAFDGCTVGNFEPTMSKHVLLKDATSYSGTWEPDKLTETMIIDGGSSEKTYNNGATGFGYILFRNHTVGQCGVSPRQLRAITSTFSVPYVGLGAYPLGFYEFVDGCSFGGSGQVFWGFNPQNDAGQLTLGSDATWSGDQLRIPRGFGSFERWLINSTPGAVLSKVAGGPFTKDWGYIKRATSPGDGSALWLDVVWVDGTKPTSGTLYLQMRRRLYFASDNSLASGTTWASPKFSKETAEGHEDGWDFPAGYPPELAG